MEKPNYYNTAESVAEYIEMAKDVNGRQLINILASFLDEGSSVLEIGSGPGTDWKILKESYQVTGSDNSIIFLDHLQSQYPAGHFLNIDAVSMQVDLKFDAIYSNKVLHHLKNEDLERSIENQWNVLNDNGIICHSFWEGEGSEVFKGLFVNYHTADAIENLIASLFNVLSLTKYEEFEQDDSILLIAQKKE